MWFVLSLAMLLAALGAAAPAHANKLKGEFLGPGVYATKDGCAKLKALEAGGDRNAGTVPDTLSADGFSGWEGACTFRSIIETTPGRVWKASMDCHEGAMEGPETDIYEKMPDGGVKVTVMGNAMMFYRCDAEKDNRP